MNWGIQASSDDSKALTGFDPCGKYMTCMEDC